MNPDLQPLRDIHDALGHPWWPLAPGWWLLLALVLGVAALIWHYRRARPVLPAIPLLQIGDWRSDARRELKRLRRAPRQTSLKVQIAELSELLKRIAMARYGRAACAGLHGQAWLDWLSAQDPDGFDWVRHGQILVHAPYAPAGLETVGQAVAGTAAKTSADCNLARELQQLITATDRWITAPLKGPKRRAHATKSQSGKRPIGKLGIAFGKLRTAFSKRRSPPESG